MLSAAAAGGSRRQLSFRGGAGDAAGAAEPDAAQHVERAPSLRKAFSAVQRAEPAQRTPASAAQPRTPSTIEVAAETLSLTPSNAVKPEVLADIAQRRSTRALLATAPAPAPAPASSRAPALPPGWAAIADASGNTYYYNESTQETTWVQPQDPELQPVATESELPAGWSSADDGAGNTYFINEKTGETTWNRPT